MGEESKDQHTEENCIMKGRVEELFTGFHDVATRLADNQEQMVKGMAKLEGKMESISCLEKRMDKRVDKIEESVQTNTKSLYKLVGGVAVITTLLPIILQHFM